MISIIVPMYNVQDFIERCVNSILLNNFKDYELILVNDGSSDNTINIVNEIAKKDKRIKIIDNSHNGVSYSRNTGIKQAKGDYIGFIDADDEIMPNYLDTLYSLATKYDADWVYCDSKIVDDGFTRPDIDNKAVFDKETIIDEENLDVIKSYIFFNDDYLNRKSLRNPVMSLYRTSIIKDNDILFNENLNYGEDVAFNFIFVQYIKKFVYIPEGLYIIHRIANSSQSRFFSNKDNADYLVTLFDDLIKTNIKFNEDISFSQMRYFILESYLILIKYALDYNVIDALRRIKTFKVGINKTDFIKTIKANLNKGKDYSRLEFNQRICLEFMKYNSYNLAYLLFRVKKKIFG